MADFPLLKTGAVTQYPLQRSTRFQTQAIRFLDGSQQKYRLYGAGLRRWSVKLDLLDDSELAALMGFMEGQGSSPFPFKDPVTGLTVARCAMGGNRFHADAQAEMTNTAELIVEELP